LKFPFVRRRHWFRQIQPPSQPLNRDVAIPLRHLDTICEHFFRGFLSSAVNEDPLALLHFQSYLVNRDGAAPNPTMTTPFNPLGGSFQTGLSPTTSRMAPKKAPRMGFPFSVPHVGPLVSPNGTWDRRCRDFSQEMLVTLWSIFRRVKVVLSFRKSRVFSRTRFHQVYEIRACQTAKPVRARVFARTCLQFPGLEYRVLCTPAR